MHLTGMNGAIPLTWGEIHSYCVLKNIQLSDFESSVIMRMSRNYVNMLYEARDADCPAPYMTDEAREAIAEAQKQRAILKSKIK